MLQFVWFTIRQIDAIKNNPAGLGPLQPDNLPQKRALPGSAASQQDHRLSANNVEVDSVEHAPPAKTHHHVPN
jgi:hypothetical protein